MCIARVCSDASAWAGVFARITVIDVVGVGNCFCGVPSATFLCQPEAIYQSMFSARSLDIIKRYGASVSPWKEEYYERGYTYEVFSKLLKEKSLSSVCMAMYKRQIKFSLSYISGVK